MKLNKKIVLLIVLALFLALTSCTRQASTAPVASPEAEGEVPFPFDTESPEEGFAAAFATQTAIAQAPVDAPTATPETVTPTEGGEAAVPTEETGGAPDAQETTEAPATEAGGGVTAPAVPTPVVERPTTYTLQRGEWPLCIARRFDLDVASFFSANGMNMNSKPGAGTVLTIPASGNWDTATYGARSLKEHPTTYTVASGDSVYTIACKFGDVAPESILAVNNLTSASDLQVGATITIP